MTLPVNSYNVHNFAIQLGILALATACGVAIGIEREYRGKPAGVRTHALIALGAATFTLAGRYGFDALTTDAAPSDPARIAAQIVSGIGFLGAGVIFMNRSLIRGMTTAASIWATTAIAVLAGAGLIVLALSVTLLHLIIVTGLDPAERFIKRLAAHEGSIRLAVDTEAALGSALAIATQRGFTIHEVSTGRSASGLYTTEVSFSGRGSTAGLALAMSHVEGVQDVSMSEENTQ